MPIYKYLFFLLFVFLVTTNVVNAILVLICRNTSFSLLIVTVCSLNSRKIPLRTELQTSRKPLSDFKRCLYANDSIKFDWTPLNPFALFLYVKIKFKTEEISLTNLPILSNKIPQKYLDLVFFFTYISFKKVLNELASTLSATPTTIVTNITFRAAMNSITAADRIWNRTTAKAPWITEAACLTIHAIHFAVSTVHISLAHCLYSPMKRSQLISIVPCLILSIFIYMERYSKVRV